MKLKILLILLLFSCSFNFLTFANELIDSSFTGDKKEGCILYVEEMPRFPGGVDSMLQFINSHIYFPNNFDVEGKVLVSFDVMEDGTINNIKIEKSLQYLFDEVAVEIVKKMPKFIPGKNHKGEATKTRVCIPIKFQFSQ